MIGLLASCRALSRAGSTSPLLRRGMSQSCLSHHRTAFTSELQARGMATHRKKGKRQGNRYGEQQRQRVVKNDDIIDYLRRGTRGGGREVRVVGGTQTKIMDLREALDIGKRQKLDLVLVGPQAQPPTCKLMNLGLENYRRSKKQQADKQKLATKSQPKGIRMNLNIADGDFNRKLRDGIRFLSKGMDVRVTVKFPPPPRGQNPVEFRKVNHTAATALLKRYSEGLSDIAQVISNKSGQVVVSDGQNRYVDFRPTEEQ